MFRRKNSGKYFWLVSRNFNDELFVIEPSSSSSSSSSSPSSSSSLLHGYLLLFLVVKSIRGVSPINDDGEVK